MKWQLTSQSLAHSLKGLQTLITLYFVSYICQKQLGKLINKHRLACAVYTTFAAPAVYTIICYKYGWLAQVVRTRLLKEETHALSTLYTGPNEEQYNSQATLKFPHAESTPQAINM